MPIARKTKPARQPTDVANAEFLPFTRPSLDEDDIAAVVRVLESGWITSGGQVRQLEDDIATLTGSSNVVAVSSATAGMHLVLHALGIGPGDEVITPSMTWVSTANLIVLCGATPVFVDVDRDTLMADARHIERALSRRTRLIVPVHFAGAPLDLDPLRELARVRGIPLLEDAAHALGSTYRGVPIGRTGSAIFSLQAIKNVTTAEGGVICTDDDALATRLRQLRFHGLGADSWARQVQGRSASAQVLEPGYKYNLPDMNAVLALGQLRRLEDSIRRRARIAARYVEAFSGSDAIRPLALPAYPHTHAWHLFVVRIDPGSAGMTREDFMAALMEGGIGTGVHFRATHHHEYYAGRNFHAGADLDNTDWNSTRVVSLPLFPDMTDSDVRRVIDEVRAIAAGGPA